MTIDPLQILSNESKVLTVLLRDSDPFPAKSSIVTVNGHEGQYQVVNTKNNDEGQKEVTLKQM